MVSKSPKTVQTAQLLGLATRISKQRKPEKAAPPVKARGSRDGVLWVERTIRSGTRIEHPGNVVVMGDVNPGAEIVAGGNILVWGRLRGSVHAGDGSRAEASQNSDAYICALEMNPTRLQIASEIANSTKKMSSKKAQRMILKNGKFIVKTWPGK